MYGYTLVKYTYLLGTWNGYGSYYVTIYNYHAFVDYYSKQYVAG